MSKQGTIYKIKNIVNGKVYIGQTANKPNRRWQDHLSRLRRNVHISTYLQHAWSKYGEENFAFSIVCKCDVNELDEIEMSLIHKYTMQKMCYNLDGGGSYRGALHESTIKKKSEIMKAKWKDEDYVNGQGLLKPVICIDTGKVYPSVAETSREMDIPYSNISQVCLGSSGSAQGNDGHFYQFAFYEEGKKYKLKKLGKNPSPKKVVCANTGEVFNSMREAAQATGAQQGHISSCCNGKRQFAGRMDNGDWIKWVFESDYDTNVEYPLCRNEKHHTRKIQCLTTGETFDTVTEALKKYNLHSGTFYSKLNKQKYIGELADGTRLEWRYA